MKTLRHENSTNRSRFHWAKISAAADFLGELDDGLADRIIREAMSGAPVRAERLADVCAWSAERMEWHQYLEGQRLLLVREKAKRAARARARAIARQTRLNEEWQANEDRIQREWDLAHPDPHYPPASYEPDQEQREQMEYALMVAQRRPKPTEQPVALSTLTVTITFGGQK